MANIIRVQAPVDLSTSVLPPDTETGNEDQTPSLTLLEHTLPDANMGSPYVFQFSNLARWTSITGDAPPPIITWSTNNSLPIGLSLDDQGELKGSPTQASNLAFEIRAQHSTGNASRVYTIRVNELKFTASHISVGSRIACAVLPQGQVKCWGNNASGQLGNGSTVNSNTPVLVSGINNATQVTVNSNHACALLSNATVKCWGNNNTGQLGINSITRQLTPVLVSSLSGVKSIHAGALNTCAVLEDGTAKCWGNNGSGEVGDGTTTQRRVPTFVYGLTNVVDFSVGEKHACAVTNTSNVKCWGYNSNGQLGVNGTVNRLYPTLVLNTTGGNLSSIVKVSSGFSHTCAIASTGSAYCWGSNDNGQIGNGTTNQVTRAVQVSSITNAASIHTAINSSCAITISGSRACWGANNKGQFGNGIILTTNTTPKTITNLESNTGFYYGGEQGCATFNGDTLRCWGLGNSGELGDGSGVSSVTPVTVIPY